MCDRALSPICEDDIAVLNENIIIVKIIVMDCFGDSKRRQLLTHLYKFRPSLSQTSIFFRGQAIFLT